MLRVAIWDIDNCLADDAPRHHLIDWSKQGDERYDVYNAAMAQDRPAHVAEFNLMRAIGCEPVFFTGRPEKWRAQTEQWLREHFQIKFPEVHMRPDGTVGLTPVELKRRMLRAYRDFEDRGVQIIAAFDDLPCVVEMYRSYGIEAVQLKINDPTLAYDPADLVEAAA